MVAAKAAGGHGGQVPGDLAPHQDGGHEQQRQPILQRQEADPDQKVLVLEDFEPPLDPDVEEPRAVEPEAPALGGRERRDHQGAEARIAAEQEPVRVIAQQVGHGGQKGGDGIDRRHRLGVEKPQAHELVVEVVLVRGEGHAAGRDALGHDGQRVQHREVQQQERQQGAKGRLALGDRQGQRDGQKAQQLAAGVANEHVGGVGVEAQ